MTAKHTGIKQQTGRLKQASIGRIQRIGRSQRIGGISITFALISISFSAAAHAQQQRYPTPGAGAVPSFTAAAAPQTPQLPTPAAITPNGAVVEDVIARVNDQIITRSEYERSLQGLVQDAQQQNVPAADLEERQKNLLRDMIDQQLLLSKGKELGITGDAETIRRLDELRKQNHLDSMEALEKAAAQQGVSYEDFKQGIRNNIITQQVVRDEVGRRLNLTKASEEAYYTAHAKEFEVPEQVHLSEILVPTPDNPTDAQIAASQAKAEDLAAKLKTGASFAELAKASSGGPTAAAGGDLGDFKRGTLGQVLEDATFPLAVGATTAPIRTRQGFVILKVDSHQAAGVPPLTVVEPQVQEAIYVSQLQPALRAYLTKAREEAYVTVDTKDGFVDSGSARSKQSTSIAFTAYAPPPLKKKIVVKQRIEQEKAAKAQAELAAARQKVAEKQAAKAAADAQKSGVKNAGYSKPVKPKKIPKEKIRYGQAPRNALPKAAAETTAEVSAPIAGQAPGVAMAPTESITSISTGTGAETDNSDPLAPVAGPQRKTRYSSRETQAEEERAKANLAKAQTKASIRPVAATQTQSATEKVQAAPLGLNGDTAKKKKKAKRDKGQPIERLQEKPKPVEVPNTVAPTVNPVLSAPGVTPPPATTAPSPDKSQAQSSDKTTLPAVNQPAPGALQQGQPAGTPPSTPQ